MPSNNTCSKRFGLLNFFSTLILRYPAKNSGNLCSSHTKQKAAPKLGRHDWLTKRYPLRTRNGLKQILSHLF
ncbi:hypothetical protein FC96_GL000679 [Secundilactobacillus kimchicus JCM 15530]|uniref:Uncharacterized protein n=1 Tax=Secundilactobacillus kimchicus JCM 15530 TaxID=1302272 RepID=A0A0R1HKP1_9LACO|nr:hypothetical protein FC96_GL000679 [Secundilactobacillus kimchicus JCM 15530]